IDGRQTFFEWASAGRYTCQNERGTMAMVTQGPIKEMYFGFSERAFVLRVDCDVAARIALVDFDELRIAFIEPSGWAFSIMQPGKSQQELKLVHEGLRTPAPDVEVGIDQIIELSIPFDRLCVQVDQPVQFFVELLKGRQSRDRAPREGTI